jgi:putative ABC transport system permease protein
MIRKVLRLSVKSILNRKSGVALSIISIAFSVVLLLGIQRVISSLEKSFSNTISGTDLIVGAPNGELSLLLATVFHKGNVKQGISWEAFERVTSYSEVEWAIPISLGDSHKGYTVIGTTDDFFSYYKYGPELKLTAATGSLDISEMNCVLGSKVAEQLGYAMKDQLVLTHGMGTQDFSKHREDPLRVSAILNPTGTPVDNALLVSLEALEHIHQHFYNTDHDDYDFLAYEYDHSVEDGHIHPESITGFYLGVRTKSDIPRIQRMINEDEKEPLLAIMPVITLLELWTILKPIENILMIISLIVLIVALGSVLTTILTNMNQRRREMAVLRSIGARPSHIFGLIIFESAAVISLGILLGIFFLTLALLMTQPILAQKFGIIIEVLHLSLYDLIIILAILFTGTMLGLLPALQAYRQTLADGLTIKI